MGKETRLVCRRAMLRTGMRMNVDGITEIISMVSQSNRDNKLHWVVI